MKTLKETTRYLVILTEYERGWDSKDFHAIEFEDFTEAKKCVTDENAKNNLPHTPDYYIVARVETNPDTFKHYTNLL